MKNRYKKSLLFGIILVGIINSLFVSNVSGAFDDDIDYEIIRNTPYSDINNITSQNINLRHSNTITQNYNATYNFLNDSFTPTNWQSDDSGGSIDIVSIDKHNKVVQLNDTNTNRIEVWNSFNTQNNGTIEFWYRSTDVSKNSFIRTYSGSQIDSNVLIGFAVDSSKFIYYDGAWKDIGLDAISNIWYHFSIHFECSLGGYKGLAQYRWKTFINEVEYGNFEFWHDKPNIDSFLFMTHTTTADYSTYFDAVGYSWSDNYTLSENIIPDIINVSSNILKPNRYEFNLKPDGLPIATSNDAITGWNQLDGGTQVSIIYNDLIKENGIEIVGVGGEGSLRGLYNDTLRFYDDQINITFSLRYLDTTELQSHFTLYVDSIYGNEIIDFRIDTRNSNSSTIQYHDGVVYQDLEIIFGTNTNESLYEFNLFIDNFDVSLLYFLNGTHNNTYSFPLILDEKGIDSIEFYHKDDNIDGNYMDIRIPYIGIYQYNISNTIEYGYISYDLENDWSDLYHNLINLVYYDYIRSFISDEFFLCSLRDYEIITNFNNIPIFKNVYNDLGYVENAFLILITNQSINPLNISFSISGVLIREGINNYYPTYVFHNVDKNVNYFYVSESRLNFIGYYDNFSDLEYTQCIIDINNEITVNRSFGFHHYYNGIGKGNFILNYSDDTYNLFDISVYFKSERILIEQDKVITHFILTSTDNNNSGYTNRTTYGYIRNLSLNYLSNLGLFYTTTSLINLMIPLIIILIPSLAILNKYGKNGFFIVFLLMCVILVASEMIPTWVFFIVSLSISYLLLSKKGSVNNL